MKFFYYKDDAFKDSEGLGVLEFSPVHRVVNVCCLVTFAFASK